MLEKLFQEKQKMSLTPEEKARMKSRLVSYMRLKPVRNAEMVRRQYRGSSILDIINLIRKPMPIVLAIALLLTGGISLAANNTLPGDLLYPVKVNVNENVQGFFQFSDTAKANWNIILADRRLDEAEKLAVEGKLTTATSQELESGFEDSANNAQDNIAALSQKANYEAAVDLSSKLATALQAHQEILVKISQKGQGIEAIILPLSAKVEAKAQESVKDKEDADEHVSSQPNIEAATRGKLNASENKIAEVENFLSARANSSASADAKAQLDLAKKAVADGKVKLDAKAYADAFVLFQDAQTLAQKAKIMVEAKEELDVDIELGNGNSEDHERDNEEENTSPSPSVSPSPSPSASPSPSPQIQINL